MKVMVAASVEQGLAESVEDLIDKLRDDFSKAGHQVDSFMLPYNPKGNIGEQELAIRLVSIKNECDYLIAVNYPASCLEHSKKIVILMGEDTATKQADEAENMYSYINGRIVDNNRKPIDISKEILRI